MRKVIRGKGLMLQVYRIADDSPADREAINAGFQRLRSPDEKRARNAEEIRSQLALVQKEMLESGWQEGRGFSEEVCGDIVRDLPDPEAFRHWIPVCFGEDHGYSLGHEWLLSFDLLQNLRDAEPPDLSRVIDTAHDLGRIRERMVWRAEADPETGVRREQLAIERQKLLISLLENIGGRNAKNAERKEAAELWKSAVRDVKKANPGMRPVKLVAECRKEFKRRGIVEFGLPDANGNPKESISDSKIRRVISATREKSGLM